MAKKKPVEGVDPKSTDDLKVTAPKAKPAEIARALAEARLDEPASETMALVMADPVLAPIMERASLNQHQWGELAAITPAEAIVQEVQRSQALVLWMEDEMNAHGGISTMAKQFQFDGGGKHIHDDDQDVLIRLYPLYTRAREHLARVCKMAEDMQLAARMVTLNENRAKMMFAIMTGLLQDPRLGLSKEQQQVIPGLLRTHIEATARSSKHTVPIIEVTDAD